MNEFYIHRSSDWDRNEFNKLKADIKRQGYEFSKSAAIGEGAGGSGLDSIIEVLYHDPMVDALLGTILTKIVESAWRYRPKLKKNVPAGVPVAYQLIVHHHRGSDRTIIGINLDSKSEM